MSPKFKIDYLANHKQHIEACAAWIYGRWGVKKPEGSLDKALAQFTESAQFGALPLTLVAIDEDTDLPVAMGSLWHDDIERWSDLGPWVAALYTHYMHRGKGVATAMVYALEQEAKKLGFQEIYLGTGSAAPLYIKCGYEEVETVPSEETLSTTETLFKKAL